MTVKDQIKLFKVGFIAIRLCDKNGPAIKYKDEKQAEWKRLGQIHFSKAARNRAMKELLESDYYIEL